MGNGKGDALPEQAFYMVGAFDEVERKAKEIAKSMGQDVEEEVDDNQEDEVIKEKEVVAPMYYLNKLVGITETVAGDVLKTMKKKKASPEAIQRYEHMLGMEEGSSSSDEARGGRALPLRIRRDRRNLGSNLQEVPAFRYHPCHRR